MKLFRLLVIPLLLLALTACQSAFLTNLAAGHGDRLFWDDFNDTSGGWPIYVSEYGEYVYAAGAYRLTVNTPFYDIWALSGHAYQDVQVEVDAARLAGPPINMYGLICRAVEETKFYFFVISSDGYYTIGKMTGSQASLLGQEMMAYNSGIAGGEGINHLRFDCINTTLTGYINGQMVALTDDSDYRQGDAGVIAGSFDEAGVQVYFDDFVVLKP